MRNVRVLLLACGFLLPTVPVHAQSDAASRELEGSVEASLAVPAAAFDLLAAGGELSVAAVRPVGGSVQVVLHAVDGSAEFTVDVADASADAFSNAVGEPVTIALVNGGALLSVGGVMIAFAPSAAIAALTHHRELHP